MARAVLILAALTAWPAAADPVSLTALATLALSSAVPAAGITIAGFTVSATAVTAAIGVAGALAGAVLTRALAPRTPSQARQKRSLAQVTSLPPYRFVYGETQVYLSPLAMHNDEPAGVLYLVMLANSRPSQGGFTLVLDRNDVALTGDPLSDAGAAAAAAPYEGFLRVWWSLGARAAPPPLFAAEQPGVFSAQDIGRGLTVVWLRIARGPARSEGERWPAWPPAVELRGRWSKVRDVRIPAQTDNPVTWGWSSNPALCALDALRRNPVREWPLAQIDLPSVIQSADACDEAVTLAAGGTEPRYRAHGALVWGDAELEDQVEPLLAAAAGRFVRFGARLGMTVGALPSAVYTMTDVLDEAGLEVEILRAGRDLATTIAASWTDPAAGYEPSESLYDVPGGQAADGGLQVIAPLNIGFCQSGTQARRIAKIEAHRNRAQRRIRAVLPPDAIDVVAGSGVQVALPSPYAALLNGLYECERVTPTLQEEAPDGLSTGVSGRCPVELREVLVAGFEWSAAEEAPAAVPPPFDPASAPLAPPGAIGTESGDGMALATGDAILPRIRFAFAPAADARVTAYEIEARPSGGAFTSLTMIGPDVRDIDGDVFGFLDEVVAGAAYDIRARSRGVGRASVWVEALLVLALGPDIEIDAPSNGAATGGAGAITVSFRAPNDPDFRAIRFFRAASDDSGLSALIAGPIFGAAGSTYEITDAGLGPGVTRFYWARAEGPFGALSPFSASVSATTDP